MCTGVGSLSWFYTVPSSVRLSSSFMARTCSGTVKGVIPRKKPVGSLGREVAEILRETAQQQGMTYRPLSAAAGLSLNRLGIIFRNEGPAASIDELGAIAEVLDTTASAVVSEAEARLEMGDALGEARVEASDASDVEGRVVEVYGLEPPSVDDLGVAAKRGSADPYEDIGEESQWRDE